jgi:hypothetical protein
MSSYLSQLLHRRLSVAQALGKSVGYLKAKAGLTPTDAQVDDVVAKAEAAAQFAATAVQTAFADYIRTHAPLLPADVIAAQAATVGLHIIDAAIAGAGNVVKANN